MAGMLTGKVALVTGAGSGIGRASALAFAREGASVVVADIVAEAAEETAQLISRAGGKALHVACDVTRSADVEKLVAETVKAFGRLDCAHNNAGIEGELGRTTEHSEENFDRIIAVNLRGVWLCLKYEILEMLKHRSGAIVNTASAAGLVGSHGMCAYTASKHGVVGLTKTAALEFAAAGIRVNAVCPGVIDTPMVQRMTAGRQKFEARLLQIEPVGRKGRPEEIAEAVVWLCSDRASFVTGCAMPVDGGMTAQ